MHPSPLEARSRPPLPEVRNRPPLPEVRGAIATSHEGLATSLEKRVPSQPHRTHSPQPVRHTHRPPFTPSRQAVNSSTPRLTGAPAPIAQLVELRTFNPQVPGSSPGGGTQIGSTWAVEAYDDPNAPSTELSPDDGCGATTSVRGVPPDLPVTVTFCFSTSSAPQFT